MSAPLVSAVITTHNRKGLLLKAIRSVQGQTYAPSELIVVDDASTDGTRQLMEGLSAKQGFTYIPISPEQSRGGNHARNTGVLAAKGKYVAFLDDDDRWFPEKTQKQVEYLEGHPHIWLVTCLKNVITMKNGKMLRSDRQSSEGASCQDMRQTIFIGPPFTTSSLMISREALLAEGLFDEHLLYWQEYELLIRLCAKSEVGLVPENLLHYYVYVDDRGRLTNNYAGFQEAVHYINVKHRFAIKELPEWMKEERKTCILHECIGRAVASGEKQAAAYWRSELWKHVPALRYWLLWRFGAFYDGSKAVRAAARAVWRVYDGNKAVQAVCRAAVRALKSVLRLRPLKP